MRRTPVIKVKTPGSALLLLALAWLTATSLACISSAAQFYPVYPRPYPRPHAPLPDPHDAPIEIGGYATVGGGSHESPNYGTPDGVGAVGIYGQWNRFGLCPGLDLRLQGNSQNLRGYLIGPRVAFQPRGHLRPFRLYAEGLFGKNELNPHALGLNPTFAETSGINRVGVIGLDVHYNSIVGWRVIEFSKGDFTGFSGSHPQTIMTGILIHFP